MPLDGRDYGAQPFIAPVYAHPNARALGDGLAGALQASYSHLRTNGRLIGHTTYPQRIRSFFGFALTPTTWVTLARYTIQLPFVATHVRARLAVNAAPGTVRARIRVTDGTNTDEATLLHDVPSGADQTPDTVFLFSTADPSDPAFRELDWTCELINAPVASGFGQRTITVDAYAFNSDGTAIPFTPLLIALHWLSVG